MKKLKIILHSNYFNIILILIILISLLRAILPKNSQYTEQSTSFTGKLITYTIDGSKLSLTLKNKEKIIGTYYFKTKKEKEIFLTTYHFGDKIKLTGKFIVPNKNTTNGTFNYQKFLHHKNIFFHLKISSYQKIASSKNLYYKFKTILTNYLKKSPYLLLLILGDDSLLNQKVLTSYQENGIIHLFSISGMHISLFSSLLLKLFQNIHFSKKNSYLLTIIFLLNYLLIVTISASIIRGILFFILFSFNKLHKLEMSPLKIYFLALTLTLFINPSFIFELGFLYSFLISLTLILTKSYLNSSSYFFTILKTTFISTLISLPLTIYNFYQINFMSIIYNLFYIPFVSFILFPATILTSFCPLLLPIYKLLTTILEETSLCLAKISFGKLIFPKVFLFIYILEFILIIIFLYTLVKKRFSYRFIFLFIPLSIHCFYPYFSNSTYLKMIDVGQGDSILLHSRNESILIDTGGINNYYSKTWQAKQKSTSKVEQLTIPLLKSLGIKKLKYLILTHGDYDHLGETINLIENFKIEKIYLNEGRINYLETQIINTFDNIEISHEETQFNIGDFTLIQINKDHGEENDSSSIYYLIYNDIKMLFMGDATTKSEKYILDNYDIKDIDIIKIGHHGSDTSSSKYFIKTINPKVCLISVGKDNKFNHPKKSVLTTLKNCDIYRTDKNGTIEISLRKNNYTIKTNKS